MKHLLTPLLLAGIVFYFTSCGDKNNSQVETVRDSLALEYTVVNTLPHNIEAFTQGLVVYNNTILESTGLNNQSWIAEVNPGSGEHDKKVTLEGKYFGEGITVLHNKIYQLTYKNKIGFIYDAKTYTKLGEFPYPNSIAEGWGITHDNINLIMSDGSDHLYYLDTTKLTVVKTLSVSDKGVAVKQLNELEFVNGYIYANIWQTNYIVKIDPTSGNLVGRLDLSPLDTEAKALYSTAEFLNGIAYDKNSKCLLITGKLWPKAYLIRVK